MRVERAAEADGEREDAGGQRALGGAGLAPASRR